MGSTNIIVIVLLGVATDLALGMTGKAMDRAKEIDAKCRGDHDIERGFFHKFIKPDPRAFVPTDNFKCFVKCVMVELLSMNEEGDFDIDAELDNVPPEILEEGHRVIKACHGTKGADPCDTAYEIHKCYYMQNPELYELVLHHWESQLDYLRSTKEADMYASPVKVTVRNWKH